MKIFLRTLLAVFTLAAISLSSVYTSNAQQAAIEPVKMPVYRGEVIFVRGGFNVLSGGLDEMAAKLEEKGVKSRIYLHGDKLRIVADIVANRKKFGRKPIILVGHSWGANALLEVSDILRTKNIRVDYAATFAATDPSPVPVNVKKLTNYYFKKDGWGKPVTAVKGFQGRLLNIDMSATVDVHHFNVEKQPKLQDQVVNNALRVLGLSGNS